MSDAEWMPPLAVARLRGCHRDTVRAAIQAGELRGRFFPYVGMHLVRKEDALAWQPKPVGRPRKAR